MENKAIEVEVDKELRVEMLVKQKMMVILVKINLVKLVYGVGYYLKSLLQMQALSRKINHKKLCAKYMKLVLVNVEV